MELQELESQFVECSEDLIQCKEALILASEFVVKAREALEEARTLAILGDKFDGKNADIRKAQEADFLKNEIRALAEAEYRERLNRSKLEILQLRYDLLRYRLRIRELM